MRKKMTSNYRNQSHITNPLICIYTNRNRNEFAIGLKDGNFRAITKIGESYTRFVDAYDQTLNNENELIESRIKKIDSCSQEK